MENTVIEKKSKHSSFSLILNKFFHHVDRGGNLRTEILCGIVVFLVSICLLFVNMQLAGRFILGDLTVSTSPSDPNSIAAAQTYVSIYQGALIISFISSLLIGLIARLPFVQLSLMGLSTCFIGFLTGNSGLSYYNILFISLLSSVIYAVLASVPFIKKWVIKSFPKPVLHALPIFAGLFLVYIGISMSGFVNSNSINTGNLSTHASSASIFALGDLSGVSLIAFISVLIGFIFYVIFRSTRVKHSISWSFLITIGVFLLINVFGLLSNNFSTTSDDSYINFGRIWLIMGSQASQTTPFGDSYLTYSMTGLAEIFKNFGNVFTKGTDFSAFEGNLFLVFLSTLLSTVIFQFIDPFIVIECSKDDLDEDSQAIINLEEDNQKLYWVNAGMNVIAPFFGVNSVMVSKTSLIASKDKAKSGIVPIVASIGYLISLFILAFPALLATDNYIVGSMNEFNYFAYGNGGILYLIQGATFGIADAVIVILGLLMIEKSIKLLKDDEIKYYPIAILMIVGLLFNSFSLAILLSVSYYTLVTLFAPVEGSENKNFFVRCFESVKANIKTVEIAPLGLLVVSLLAVVL